MVLKSANIIPSYETPDPVHLGIDGEDEAVKSRSGIVEIIVITITIATIKIPLHQPLGCTLPKFCVLHNDCRTQAQDCPFEIEKLSQTDEKIIG